MNIMASKAILRADIGFRQGITLWALLKSLYENYEIHVLWACQKC